MEELDIIDLFSASLVVVGIAVAFMQLVLKFEIPYGRFSRAGFGCGVPSRISWVLQECPAFLIPSYLFYLKEGDQLGGALNVNVLLLALFMIHYFQRSFIFPLLIKTQKPTPFLSFLSAVAFCTLNGYIQSRTLTHFAVYKETWIKDPRLILGIGTFLVGMGINIHSDHILRNLRKGEDKGYKIPKGGMFHYTSGANYFGETLEWCGYAVACWNWPAAAFAIFTLLMLGARAVQYHRFYLEKFEDYPKNRKAFIPFVL